MRSLQLACWTAILVLSLSSVVCAIPMSSKPMPPLPAFKSVPSNYMKEVSIHFTASKNPPFTAQRVTKDEPTKYPAQEVVEAMFKLAWKELDLEKPEKLPVMHYFTRQYLRNWDPQKMLKYEITRDAAKHGEGTCNDNCYATATPVGGKNDHFDFEIQLDVEGEDGKLQVFSKKGVKVEL
ncbi:MAG: hypothetical protein NXY57DRAFT_310912 [Lentinula lateritia]|nr:MAG: hypothetical protein NXY57DRAFT_310912 [Lentinula lateritia]